MQPGFPSCQAVNGEWEPGEGVYYLVGRKTWWDYGPPGLGFHYFYQ